MLDRAEWRRLAGERVLDVEILMQAGRWSAAYHLIGYAVECGLKACILAYVEDGHASVIFEEKRYSELSWSHNPTELINQARLRTEFDRLLKSDSDFKVRWDIIRVWSEVSRYDEYDESRTRELYEAIADPQNGLLTWIRQHW